MGLQFRPNHHAIQHELRGGVLLSLKKTGCSPKIFVFFTFISELCTIEMYKQINNAMKRLLIAFAFAIGTIGAQAYEYSYLTVQTADGNSKSIATEQLVLTFQNGQLVATNGEGSQTFTLTELSKMFFDASASGIEKTVASDSATVEVYTLAGVFVGRFETMTQAEAALKQGIYLIKTNGQTKKVAIK
jgi:hypothetical protein